MNRSEVAFVAAVVILTGAAITAEGLSVPRPRIGQAARVAPLLSSSSYCPAPGPEQAGEGTYSVVATANFGAVALPVRTSAVGGGVSSPFQVAELPARRFSEISTASLGIPESVGIVETFGSRSRTDQTLLAPESGVALAACSPSPSDRWLFAAGSTARGKDTFLLLANPFQEEARLKVRMITPTEDTVPSLLADLIVPGLDQTVLLLAEYFPETESFGFEVTATRGRIIASRFQRVATREGLRGITLGLGARGTRDRWLFAGGEVPSAGEETIYLANPHDTEALVRIQFPTDTEVVTLPALQEVAIPAGRQVAVNVSEHLPRGTNHGVEVVSSNRVSFVAERIVMSPAGSDSAGGVGLSYQRAAVSVGSSIPGSSSIALVNFEQRGAVVKFVLITDQAEIRPPELAAIVVEAGRRATIDLTPFLGGKSATVVLEAVSGKIVAEHRLALGDPFRDFGSNPAEELSSS